MKNIKVLLVVTTLFLSIIICAQPQSSGQQDKQQGPPPIPTETQINEMVGDLALNISLTDEQEASVLKLYTKHFEVVKTKISGNAKPKREEMEALKKDFENTVKTFLTADQQKGYEAYLKKNEQRKAPK